MVELFTVSFLSRSPRLSAPIRLVAKSSEKLPTPDRLNEVCDSEPPCAGLLDMMNSQSEFHRVASPALMMTALVGTPNCEVRIVISEQGLSASPPLPS